MTTTLLQPIVKVREAHQRRSQPTTAPTRLRAAQPADVREIAALINHYAALGQMLPRKEESVRQNIHEFIVAEANHTVIACGALHGWDEESAEVRSLAVAAEFAGQGLGKQIVNRLIEQGVERDFHYAFSLTLQVRFFEKLGFHVVKKSALPQKVWGDCIICPFLYNCHETAMIRYLKS